MRGLPFSLKVGLFYFSLLLQGIVLSLLPRCDSGHVLKHAFVCESSQPVLPPLKMLPESLVSPRSTSCDIERCPVRIDMARSTMALNPLLWDCRGLELPRRYSRSFSAEIRPVFLILLGFQGGSLPNNVTACSECIGRGCIQSCEGTQSDLGF